MSLCGFLAGLFQVRWFFRAVKRGELFVGEPGCTLVGQRSFRYGLRLFLVI